MYLDTTKAGVRVYATLGSLGRRSVFPSGSPPRTVRVVRFQNFLESQNFFFCLTTLTVGFVHVFQSDKVDAGVSLLKLTELVSEAVRRHVQMAL